MNAKLKYGLVCQHWGPEEDAWITLFNDYFLNQDAVELFIYLPRDDGKNVAIINHRLQNDILKRTDPVEANVHEVESLGGVTCDYWLGNPFLKAQTEHFLSGKEILWKIAIGDLDKSYCDNYNKLNIFEYNSLVDSYDFEKTKRDINQTDKGYLIPEKFGSSGGQGFEDVLSLLDSYCSEDANILEVGCGAGAFYKTLLLNDKRYKYSGLDRSRKQVLRCQKNYPEAKFRVANAWQISDSDNIYDFVFEHAVMIFLLEPLRAIEEMCRLSQKYIYFKIGFTPEKGLLCYHPFHLTCDKKDLEYYMNISPYAPWGEADDGKVSVSPYKCPRSYIPSQVEWDDFFSYLQQKYSLDVLLEKGEKVSYPLFVNNLKKDTTFVDEQHIIEESDEYQYVDLQSKTFLLQKR